MSTPTIQLFRDVAFFVYPVRDVKKARPFYEGVLGLVPTANWQDEWVEYDIGHGTLVITTANEKHVAGSPGAVIGLEVVSYDSALEHVKAHAIPFAEVPQDGTYCRGFSIRDPDGNEIVFHARK